MAGQLRVARVGTDRLNVRMSPSISAPIVDRLAEGALVEATGPTQDADGHTWLAVRGANGAEGWASKAYLDAVARRYRVTEDQVRLRQRAGTDAPILAELSRGTLVDDAGVVELSAVGGLTWRQVRADGQVGWIAVDYLDAVQTGGGTAGSGGRFRVTDDAVRLRMQPSVSATIVAELRRGVLVEATDGELVSADGRQWRHVKDGARSGWIAAELLRDASGTVGRYRFDSTIPTELQVQPWTCSIRSTTWMLKSIGIAITPEEAQDGMSPRYANADLGLLDASGAGIVEFLGGRYGVEAFNRAPISLDEVAEWAGRYPVAIGGRAWNHWSAVRGVNSDGNLVLANPGGTGPRFGQQTLNRDQFEQLGWFSAVVIPCD